MDAFNFGFFIGSASREQLQEFLLDNKDLFLSRGQVNPSSPDDDTMGDIMCRSYFGAAVTKLDCHLAWEAHPKNFVSAIKFLRSRTGVGLKDSKECLEQYPGKDAFR